jgi:hypothetical protein
MRGFRRAGLASIATIALSVPASAGADVLSGFQRLAARHLRPAPLVPTAVPGSLSPLGRTFTLSGSRSRSGYAWRLVHYSANGPDAIIALERGAFKTVAATLRYDRRLGFKARPTRVRGHRGYLLTRKLGPTQWSLVWMEGGVVYEMGTGTPKKISVEQLRATASGLDHLERDYVGSHYDANDNELGAVLVTTRHTVSGEVSWSAQCTLPDGSLTTAHAGTADITVLRRQGNAFSFDIASHLLRPDAWSGTVSGVVGPNAITLNLHASGVFDGSTCDTGPVSLTLDQHAI